MRNIFLLFILIQISTVAQEIKIGVFNKQNIKKVFFEANKGKYKLYIDGKKKYTLKGSRSLIIKSEGEQIIVSLPKKDYSGKNIFLKGKKKAVISIKPVVPKQKARQYYGSINILAKPNKLVLINLPPFQKYLAGVVEAESGTSAKSEYYKTQAIICRTYALQKWDKHKKDGFNLCDGVHCQAYKGVSTTNDLIRKSVKKTDNFVILDKNNHLIEALFSANCGGQTNSSEMVWSSVIPYLRSVKDPYCINQRQAKWEKTIPLSKFISFLKSKGLSIPATISVDSFKFKQPNRVKYYIINNQKVKLTSLRFGLGLRSTFFEIEPSGSLLKFHGRGYGHGVGMCQEGAMNMAKKGKKYDEIIKFYYTGVKIKPMKQAVNLPK
ncbi:MAG: SpoIID/LytB domain-containing protein [Bacteroidales bacterium]|nr:SpoIID/LytB domain-containing protein [Bacteroidales bacterium]